MSKSLKAIQVFMYLSFGHIQVQQSKNNLTMYAICFSGSTFASKKSSNSPPPAATLTSGSSGTVTVTASILTATETEGISIIDRDAGGFRPLVHVICVVSFHVWGGLFCCACVEMSDEPTDCGGRALKLYPRD